MKVLRISTVKNKITISDRVGGVRLACKAVKRLRSAIA